jgi:hypothetical protein
MKIYKTHTIIFLICGFFIIACDDNLDIEPEQNLTPEAALGSAVNIQNILVGAYDLLGQEEIYSGDYNLASELIANTGELAWKGTFQGPAEFDRKAITSSNGFVTDYWIYSYYVSNQVNLVLENIDKFEDLQERSIVEGEAKFLRAIVYFDLARFYALPYEAGNSNDQLAVPIVTMGVSDAPQIDYPARNTVEEVYAFIIQDLDDAIDLLPAKNPKETFYANSLAAQALLARVYLQQANYTGARNAANAVIASEAYSLTEEYSSAFNNAENSTEDIFALQITAQDGINDMNTFWAIREFGGRSLTGDVTVEQPYFDLFDDENDARAIFFYAGNETLLSTKWQNQFANVPFLRLAEMYLIRAESNFRMGTEEGATPLEDINILRARAGAKAIDNLDLGSILLERKKELGFEGFALHDIKRLKKSIGNLAYDANTLVLPIPQREIDANPELKQNPGYTN